MHDDEIRALVREAVARHLGTGPGGTPDAQGAGRDGPPFRPSPQPSSWKAHFSHGRFVFLAPSEPDAPCVVEPQVKCHHCGFCQSYGH